MSCEKDDICIEDTVGTPHLIIRFYDAANPTETKTVPNLQVESIDAPDPNIPILSATPTDSIAIPLRVLEETTDITLINDYGAIDDNGTPSDDTDDIPLQNEDFIIISYTNQELFISRACGYKNIFNLQSFNVTTDTDNWIINSEIINNPVENETNAHIHIFH